MRVYRHSVIDPRNQDRRKRLEEVRRRFTPMTARERRRLTWRVFLLNLILWLAGWNRRKRREMDAARRLAAIEAKIDELRTIKFAYYWQLRYYSDIPERIQLIPVIVVLFPIIRSLMIKDWNDQQARRKIAAQEHARRTAQLRKLQHRYDTYKAAAERLRHDAVLLARQQEEAANRREFEREVKVMAQIIRGVWGNLSGCHYVQATKDGKEKKITPTFDKVWVQSHSVTFRVKTSAQGVLGWKSTLPYKVLIKNLYAEETLETINAALDRQVTAKWNKTRTRLLIRVNRLDAPNAIPGLVPFSKMMEAYPFNDSDSCPFPIGVDENNVARWLNFHIAPHVLIAGATRGGKSNHLKGIITSLLLTQSPADLRLVLIDNKRGVEFRVFEHVPHLVDGICKHTDTVLETVSKVEREMSRRLQLFESASVTNILEYNDKVSADMRLPRLLMIVDELQPIANLGDLSKEIYKKFSEIGALGAAAGINSILCTQFPDKNTIRSNIKANFLCRIAFKTSSGTDSMVAIKNHAAFNLPSIRGRAVFVFDPDPIEVQTALCAELDTLSGIEQAYKYGRNPLPFYLHAEVDEIRADGVRVAHIKVPRRKITEEEFVEMALTKLEGKLSPRNAHILLGDQSPGERYLNNLLERLKEQQEVCWQGDFYRIGRDRMAYTLKPAPAHQVVTDVAHP